MTKQLAKRNPKNKQIEVMKSRLKEIYHLSSAMSLLGWDQQVYMPHRGAESRASTMAHLSVTIHEKFLKINSDGLLDSLRKKLEADKLVAREAIIVKETCRSYDREKKLPASFVRELAETIAKTHSVWKEARRKSDFKMFLPWLKKIVALKRKEAELVGYKKSPYDALLDVFEPEMTTEKTAKILNDLKDFLVLFVKKIAASKVKVNAKIIKGEFSIEEQKKFNQLIAEKIGFNLEAGRIDQSAHPFTIGFHPHDVRITTRHDKNNLLPAIFSTIHETGHALYEQGLLAEHFGTPLAESISLGIHESQSRLWENLIGRSLPFWKYFYPKLQKEFPEPFKSILFLKFYKAINKVEPSFIRTEADEITYNLHIIIRFEIEKLMIEGSIRLADLPKIWNQKVKKYLGIKVRNDAQGVLQDVHWSSGLIGYFPTYAFGNLYAAQFYNSMRNEIFNLDKKIEAGHLSHVREWLRKKIYVHGKSFTADALVKEVTGESLNSRYFIDYLEKKYKEIYKL
ncbi:MAG: carboxypeptidase M32 [Patescibacteria group bacterium]